ncbi:hypothetical protein [Reyranella sp.]|uniref:hypothetical protein n=1 Tax=Reyranella sp. TaxID=1929291 RepID=UPI003D0C2B57
MPARRTVLRTTLGIPAAALAGTGHAWADEAPFATNRKVVVNPNGEARSPKPISFSLATPERK